MEESEFYRRARTDLRGPLDGVRVLDVSKVWAGPMASAVLGDLGAEVVRVEMPGSTDGDLPPDLPGTTLSWFRQTVQRNKRSIGLDLRTPPAREVFLRLARSADVVVENYKPGTLDKWGIGYEGCRAVRQDVVFVSISGWGQYGPAAGKPGYDPIAQAASGWMSLNGEPHGDPVKAPTYLADDLAALQAVIGTLAALRHRDRTGEGQHVDVALLDSLLAASGGFLTLAALGVPLPRWGNQADIVAPAGVFGCSDGHVYIAVALNKHWRLLAGLIGRPELASAPGFATNRERRDNRDAVDGAVAAWCKERPLAEVVAALEAHGLSIAAVRTFAEAAADPDVRARGMVQETVLSDGTPVPLTGPPVKFSGTPTRIRSAAPEPGADTSAVLAELGVAGDELAALRASGALG